MSLEPAEPAAVRIHWSVPGEAWAQLDAEFPGSVGATHALLRLRLIRWNGSVQQVAVRDLGGLADAGCGTTTIPLVAGGDYEAELGLASDDGGWLVLSRSARRRCSAPGLPEAASPPPTPEGRMPAWPAAPANPAGQMRGAEFWDAPSGRGLPAAAGLPQSDIGDGDAEGGASHQGWGEGPATPGYEARPRAAPGLEVQAELLIYGSAPPGTLVDLYGRTIEVGPGGAFSLRIPIQDPELLRRALTEAPDPLAELR